MPYSERWAPGSTVAFTRCEVTQRGSNLLYPPDVQYRDCLFQAGVTINGREPQFNRCEFAAPVKLVDRTAAVFQDCLFHQALVFDRFRGFLNTDGSSPWGNKRWWVADPATPEVGGNSFLGQTGLHYEWTFAEQQLGDVYPPSSPIPIASNYYGETTGPERVPGEFLSGLGAGVGDYFSLAAFNNSGRRSTEKKVFPSFWIDGWVAGQYALGHGDSPAVARHRIYGKETLLSVLVGTSADRVTGVNVRVTFNGQPVEMMEGAPVPAVVGSLGDANGAAVANGRHTFNFLLPPVETATAPLTIQLDTTGVSGYPDSPHAGELYPIIAENLAFNPPVAVPFRLLVQPVHVLGYGSAGDASGFANQLKDLLAAMLPLRRQDIDIRIAPEITYAPGADYSYGLSLYPLAAAIASTNKIAGLGDWFLGTDFSTPFTVALLPPGVLGEGVEGANVKLFRGTLFVTADKAKATIHELGHGGPGLYLDTEQYDLPAYEASGGKPLEGVTAFVNEPNSTFKVDGPAGRFVHTSKPGYAWKGSVPLIDIMGAIEPSWIHPDTLTDLRNYLTGLLGTAVAADEPAADPPPPGTRRVFLSMATVRHPSSTRHLPDLGTIRLFDATSFAQRTAGTLRDPAFTKYHIVAFDASDQIVFWRGFDIADEAQVTQPPPLDRYWWSASCDLPDSAVRLVVRNQQETGITYFDHALAPALSAQLLAPASGSVLGDTLAIRWSAPVEATPVVRSQPLQHLVLASHDGGASWIPVSAAVEGETLQISTRSWYERRREVAAPAHHRWVSHVGFADRQPDAAQPPAVGRDLVAAVRRPIGC
ncbi:MAG: hypothetical protein R3F11_25620 [Verrucomicrobiales bacterium]